MNNFKKNVLFTHFFWEWSKKSKKCISIMKYSFFFLFVGLLQAVATVSYSQVAKFTFDMEDVTVAQVITQIENDSQFYFTYNTREINPGRKVSIHLQENDIHAAMNQLFAGENVNYIIADKHVVLYKDAVNKVQGSIQQGIAITGMVTDATGEPLPGVTVVIKSTQQGTATDGNGAFSLQVPDGSAVLVFSYIGYTGQEILVGSQRNFIITLNENARELEEVVVIGYGVQKKKLVTGATVSVSGDKISKLSTDNPFTALQSMTPGVNITQRNGQPGEGYFINIRGIGTNGESRPLYVVDGVASGNDALNNMSAADIESIDILKDAASAAIYGARAANGVVLITTKQGKSGKPVITYDGYFGRQYMYKKPDMLNAKQYIMVQDEISFNEGTNPFDWERLLPQGMYNDIMTGKWNGSDWVDAFYNKGAQTQQHSLNITGGNEYSKFSMGYSNTQRDGIFGGPVQSKFNRKTFRVNSDHVFLKIRDFDAIKVGETVNYTYSTRQGIATDNIYWNSFHDVLVGNPLMPIYNEEGDYYAYADKAANGWNFDSNFANPIALSAKSSRGLNLSKSYNLNASAYLQIQPVKNLIFKFLYGYKMSGNSYRSQNQKMYLSNTTNVVTESISQSEGLGHSWTLDNTVGYNWDMGLHRTDVLLGMSLEKWGYGENVSSGGNNNIFDLGWDYAWVNNTKPVQLSDRSAGGSPWGEGGLASFYGRINYNYNEKYLATLILRSDGSSNFAQGHRWGTFPSVSAGWVISNESFLESAKGTLDFLKLRASWGQNGNQSINPYQYLTTYLFPGSALYYFGATKNTPYTGAISGVLKNPDITWETSVQTDVGIDARFLSNRLGLSVDFYNKTTKDWLLVAPISATWGFSAPYVNGGAVKNTGVEVELTWNHHINDFRYNINLNGSYNKNEVTQIANAEGIIHGDPDVLSASTSEIYRLQVGYPMGFFYGYKADGIFQTTEEVNAYTKNGNPILPGAKPGDVRFVDINGDGKIDPDDRTMIGCGWPKTRLGLSLNLGYKGFDFLATASGAFGFQIAKSYRSFTNSPYQNYSTDVFDRWYGAGTSNTWPMLTTGGGINYQYISNIFLEKGDYVKIQNLTIGYDFKRLFPRIPASQARLYFTAQNLFTITGYSGMDPEVGYGYNRPWVSSIDLGYYPSAKTYLAGINLTF